jgi:hypothetical protein
MIKSSKFIENIFGQLNGPWYTVNMRLHLRNIFVAYPTIMFYFIEIILISIINKFHLTFRFWICLDSFQMINLIISGLLVIMCKQISHLHVILILKFLYI